MKWNVPKNGQEKSVIKFCWLPCRAGTEKVWLEKVTIRQIYIEGFFGKWKNLYFE